MLISTKTKNILYLELLPDSANTNYRHFQVKINCSKFIIDGIQQRCHMSLLVSLFLTSRNLFFWCVSAKKKYYSLVKNNHKFPASVMERCTSLSKSSGIFQQNPLKVPVNIFLTYLQKRVCIKYYKHILYSYSSL